jgi:hypothetical protein
MTVSSHNQNRDEGAEEGLSAAQYRMARAALG